MKPRVWVRACGTFMIVAALIGGWNGTTYLGQSDPSTVFLASTLVMLLWSLAAFVSGLGLLFLAPWARRLGVGVLVAYVIYQIVMFYPLLFLQQRGLVGWSLVLLGLALRCAIPLCCVVYLRRSRPRDRSGSRPTSASPKVDSIS